LRTWRLLDLGEREPYTAQLFCEAVAQALEAGLVKNTLILVQPSAPYVCLGYHQNYATEIDEAYCKERGLPVILRQQGGGTTYLDRNQIFYQVVVDSEDPVVQGPVADRIKKILAATIHLYRRLGLKARVEGSDVTVRGRKISGNAAGALDGAHIIVGNILVRADHSSMCNILRSPNPTFKSVLCSAIRRHITSFYDELGSDPGLHLLKSLLIEGFQKNLDLVLTRDGPRHEESYFFKDVLRRHDQELRERIKAGEPDAVLRRVKVMSNRHVASTNMDTDWAVVLEAGPSEVLVFLSYRDSTVASYHYTEYPSPQKICEDIIERIPGGSLSPPPESLSLAIKSILEAVKSS